VATAAKCGEQVGQAVLTEPYKSCKAPPCQSLQCGAEGKCLYKSSAEVSNEVRMRGVGVPCADLPPGTVIPVTKAQLREFATGATRDLDDNKLDYEGFYSPLVVRRFAEYMHKNRLQKDGSLRSSDNWQKGIPRDAYMKSLFRHFMDVWTGHRAGEVHEEELCAILFNVQGYLFEILKEKAEWASRAREIL
jgi:hypothetical protein